MASFGESATKAILWHIERNSHLKLKEIPAKPGLFIKALKEMLGPGSWTVERMIVREIDSAFNITSKAESFEEAVTRARKVGNE